MFLAFVCISCSPLVRNACRMCVRRQYDVRKHRASRTPSFIDLQVYVYVQCMACICTPSAFEKAVWRSHGKNKRSPTARRHPESQRIPAGDLTRETKILPEIGASRHQKLFYSGRFGLCGAPKNLEVAELAEACGGAQAPFMGQGARSLDASFHGFSVPSPTETGCGLSS